MIGKSILKIRQYIALFFIVTITVTFNVPANLSIPVAHAAIPQTVGYQGTLKNSSGSFLTGTYSFIFRIYDAESAGTLLWSETQSSVSVSNGGFSVRLGSSTAFPTTLDFNQALYLSTEVNGDGEMSPRVTINSVPYAYTAGGVSSSPVAPTSTVAGGRMYYNTGDGSLQYYDDTLSTWRTLGTSTATAETFQSVTNRGNTTTNAIQFAGGTSTGAFAVSNGLTVTGSAGLQSLTFTNATGSSVVSTNLSATNGTITNAAFTTATSTNFFTTNATIGSLTLTSPLTVTGITWANATGTNTTSTNLFATNLFATNAVLATQTVTNGTIGSLSFTSATGTNFLATSGTITALNAPTLNSANANVSSLSFTNGTSTSWFGFNTASGSSLFVNGQSVCLANGTNCPVSSASNFQTVTNLGNTTTNAIQFAGGTSTADFVALTNLFVGTSTYSGLLGSLFSMTGDDLFLAGSFGSVSSIYTNGALVLGSGTGTTTLTANSFTKVSPGDFDLVLSDSASNWRVFTSSTRQSFTVASSGNIGIGISSPKEALDIAGNVRNILQVGQTFSVASTTIGTNPLGIFANGRYVFVTSSGDNTMSILDASDIDDEAPVVIGTVGVGSGPAGVYVSGRYAFVANSNGNSLSIVDISRPASPVTVSTIPVGTAPLSVFVSGRYAYVPSTGDGTLSIVNVSDPLNPTIATTTYSGTSSTGIYVQGRYAYVTNGGDDSLSIFDVSVPTQPTKVTTAVGDSPSGIYVQGRYAYVANTDGSMSIIDISDASAPAVVGSASIGTGSSNVFVSGRYAYVPNTSLNTLQVIDVQNPDSPVTISSIPVGASPYGVYVAGRHAFVANLGSSSVSTVDIKGMETNGLIAASGELGSLQVLSNGHIENQLTVGGGIRVGVGGLFSASGIAASTLIIGSPGDFEINEQGVVEMSNQSVIPTPPSGSQTTQLYALNFNGFPELEIQDATGLIRRVNRDTDMVVYNNTVSTITKGQAVYITGAFAGVSTVAPARANSAVTMPALGLALENIPPSSFGRLVSIGRLENTNTAAFSSGAVLYVSEATPGALTSVRPPLPNLAQIVGQVVTSDAASGTIQVIPRPPSGIELGTISPTWRIGSGTAGAKAIQFAGAGTGTLAWNPTGNFSITIPNVNGQMVVSNSALTAGSIPFVSASGTLIDNNSNFFWNNTTAQLFATNASFTNALFQNATATNVTFLGPTDIQNLTFTNATGQNLITQGVVSSTFIHAAESTIGVATASILNVDRVLHVGIGDFGIIGNSVAQFGGTTDTYLQVNIQNHSSGTNASSDYIATNDIGDDSNYYIDLGINSSNYSNPDFSVSGPNDGYLFVQGANLTIGTASASTAIVFHAGGTTAADEVLRVTSDHFVGIGTTNPSSTLDVVGDGRFSGTLTLNVATSSELFWGSATGVAMTVLGPSRLSADTLIDGFNVCLANGSNCPSGTTPNFQTVTNAGNTTTRAIQFAGGTSTGAFAITNDLSVTGTLAVDGLTSLQGLTFTDAAGANVTTTNLGVSGTVNTDLNPTVDAVLSLGSSALRWNGNFASVTTSLLFANTANFDAATITNGSITSLSFTSATGTNLFATSGTIQSLTASTGTFDAVFAASLTATSGTVDSLAATDATVNNLSATNGTITNATITSGTASFLSFANGTSTNLFSFATATGTTLISNSANITSLSASTAQFANTTSTNLFATNATIQNLTVNGSSPSSFANLIWTNATGTNTTSTNLFATNLQASNGIITSLAFTDAAGTNVTTTNLGVLGTVNTNLLPTVDGVLSLGSTALRWNGIFATVTSTNAMFTNTTSTSLFATGLGATNATVASGTVTSLSFTSATGGSIRTTSGTITSLSFTSATGTNFRATSGTITNVTATNATTTNLFATNGTLTNTTSTNSFATNGAFTNLTGTNATFTSFALTGSAPVSFANLIWTNATGTNTTSTNLFATSFGATNAVVTNGTITSLSFTSATGTNFLATSGTITSLNAPTLISSNATISGGSINGTAIGATTPSTGIFTNTTSTNSFATNALATNLLVTNGTSTNLFATNLNATNGTVALLGATTATVSSLVSTSGSIATLNTGTLNATNATIQNLTVNGSSPSSFANLIWTNATGTNTTSTNLFASNLQASNGIITSLSFTNQSGTNVTTTNLALLGGMTTDLLPTADGLLALGSSSLRWNGNFDNVTSTNATTTNLFATNLFGTNAHMTNGTITNATATNLFATNGEFTNTTSTNAFVTNQTVTNLTATSVIASTATITSLSVIGSAPSSFANLTWTNATGGNTTSTNSFATNLYYTSAHGTNLTIANATATHLFVTNSSINSLAFTSATGTNFLATSGTVTTLNAPTLISTNATVGSLTSSNLIWTNATGTNTTSTNLFATNFAGTNAVISSLVFGNGTSTGTFNFNSASGPSLLVNGQQVCLANGTNCPSSAASTLQAVTNAGNTTTNAIQFAGGTSTAPFTISASSSLQAFTFTAGTGSVLTVAGATPSSFANLTWTNVTGTYTTSSNLFVSSYARLPSNTQINDTSVCLSDGTNCPSGTTPNFQTVTNAGNTTTDAIQFAGGTSTGAFTVTSNFTVTGTLTGTGLTSLQGLTFVTGTGTNVTTTNLGLIGAVTTNLLPSADAVLSLGSTSFRWNGAFANVTSTSAVFTNSTSTNFFASSFGATTGTFVALSATTGTITNLISSSSSIATVNSTNIITRNATATNQVTTNLVFTSGTATNLFATNVTSTNGTFTNVSAATGTIASLSGTTGTIAALNTAVLNAATATVQTLTVNGSSPSSFANLIWTNATGTNTTSTNLFATNLQASNGIITSLTFTSQSGTNVTTTNLGVLGNITTNLLPTVDGLLALGSPSLRWNGNFANVTSTNVTSTNLFAANLSASTALFTTQTVASGTITSLSFTSATGTNFLATSGTITSLNAPTLTSSNATIQNLTVNGSSPSSFANLTWTNATGTNTTSTNLFATNLGAASATTTNLFVTNGAMANGTITSLSFTSATGTNFLATSGTITSLNAPTFISSNASISGGSINGTAIGSANPSTGVFTNSTSTNSTSTFAFATNLTATNGVFTAATSSNLFGTSLLFTNGTSTGWLGFGTASGSNLFVQGQAVCLANGTNCPASASPSLQTVTNSGNITTNAIQFAGGTSTGVFTVGNNLVVTGTLAVSGNSSLQGVAATNATATNATTTNLAVLGSITTNLIPAADATLSLGSNAFRWNGVFGGVTSTNATSSNLFATNAVIGNVSMTSNSVTSLSFISATGTNFLATSGTITTLTAGTASATTMFASSASFANGTSTSWFGFNTASGSNLFVQGQAVCLANGTNCPGGASPWLYDAASDFVRASPTSADLLVGGASTTNAAFWFNTSNTSSRLYVGAYGSSTNIVVGASTSSVSNTAFQLDGGDLFVSGNIGSASSVYTNGAFAAGTQTLLGNGFLTKTSGDFSANAAGNFYIQPGGGMTHVGGSSAPQATLEVGGGTHGATLGGGYDIGINAVGRAGLGLVDSTNGLGEVLMGFNTGIESLTVGTVTTQPLFFETDGNIVGGFSTIGNLGIGLTISDATTRLEVLGITSSTAISAGQILPHRNNTYDLGSATRSWANIYASGTAAIGTVSSTNLTFANGTTTGSLNFSNATATIQISNGAKLTVHDGTNELLVMKDLSTNFGAALNAGAFMDRNSSLLEEFNKQRTNVTADATGAAGAAMGDGGGWGGYESTNCTLSSLADTANGIMRIASAQAANGCLAMVDESINNNRAMLDADNLPVFLMKARPSDVSNANNFYYIGMASATDGSQFAPTSFLGFTNNGGSVWVGTAINSGVVTNATCTSMTISTTQFALLMVEVRSTTDVRFFVDPDVSNGVNFSECSTGIQTNVPTAALAPEIILQSRTGGSAVNFDIDFYRVWQDDPLDGSIESGPPTVDYSTRSGLAESFESDDTLLPIGTLVSLDTSAGKPKVKPTVIPSDPNAIGIVTNDPGLILSNGSFDGVRVVTHGRVRAKASLENGVIRSGDALTSASTPGMVMRASSTGPMIGRALENYPTASSTNGILMMVQPGYYIPGLETGSLAQLAGSGSSTLQSIQQSAPTPESAPIVIPTNFQALAVETLTVREATFTGSVVVEGTTTLRGPVILGASNAGRVKVDPGQGMFSVLFDKEYPMTPHVFLSPEVIDVSNGLGYDHAIYDGTYYLKDVTSTGFTVEFPHGGYCMTQSPCPIELWFNWMVLGFESTSTQTTVPNVSGPVTPPAPAVEEPVTPPAEATPSSTPSIPEEPITPPEEEGSESGETVTEPPAEPEQPVAPPEEVIPEPPAETPPADPPATPE